MERLPTGHVTGKPVAKVVHVFTVFGQSLEDCTKRTKAFIEAIRRIPPKTVEQIQLEGSLLEYEEFLIEELERTREALKEYGETSKVTG